MVASGSGGAPVPILPGPVARTWPLSPLRRSRCVVHEFEIRRRAGRAQVTQLHVLDLTDPAVQSALEIGDCDLVDDDYGGCQEIADAARMAGLDGVLAPSAGLAGERTLAVFTAALDRGAVTEQTGRVQVPPLATLGR